MSAKKQWRVTYSNPRGGSRGVCFIDAETEEDTRDFFAQAFPHSVIVAIALEPVDPCAQYERRMP